MPNNTGELPTRALVQRDKVRETRGEREVLSRSLFSTLSSPSFPLFSSLHRRGPTHKRCFSSPPMIVSLSPPPPLSSSRWVDGRPSRRRD